MKEALQHFFDNPFKEGYSRIIDGDECFYVPTDKLKELLLEDLNETDFRQRLDH